MPSTLTSPTFTLLLFFIFPVQIFTFLGAFLFAVFKLIFFIPAGWPNFFPASLNGGLVILMMIAFIIFNSSLVPLIEGL